MSCSPSNRSADGVTGHQVADGDRHHAIMKNFYKNLISPLPSRLTSDVARWPAVFAGPMNVMQCHQQLPCYNHAS